MSISKYGRPDKVLVNAFTVDVEEHFQVAALKGVFDPADWAQQPSRVDANTRRVLSLMAEFDVKGTFFVLGWVAERHPSLVRDIVAEGHELACHGQSHQLIYEQQPAVFREETRRAKETLEDVSGVRVNGYRAASYSITGRSAWALEEILKAGFVYDSSIMPVRHDIYGFPGAPDTPHRLQLKSGGEIIEFPPTTIELLGRRIPIGGGGYFRIFPYWFSRWGMKRLNELHDQPCSFYTHPWEVDYEQPRVKTSFRSHFRHYTNLRKCEEKIRLVLEDFDFTAMQTVLESLQLPAVDFEDYAVRNSDIGGGQKSKSA